MGPVNGRVVHKDGAKGPVGVRLDNGTIGGFREQNLRRVNSPSPSIGSQPENYQPNLELGNGLATAATEFGFEAKSFEDLISFDMPDDSGFTQVISQASAQSQHSTGSLTASDRAMLLEMGFPQQQIASADAADCKNTSEAVDYILDGPSTRKRSSSSQRSRWELEKQIGEIDLAIGATDARENWSNSSPGSRARLEQSKQDLERELANIRCVDL